MKHLTISILFAVLFLGGVGQIKGEPYSYSAVIASVEHVVEKPAVAQATPKFVRSRTVLQNQPCKDSHGGYYESDILSVEEIEYNLKLAGFTPEQAHVMQAIAKAESGHQLNCFGDETLADSKWDSSYGIYQIRGLKAERGKGSCRDLERLNLNILEQSKCAYEISGKGTNFRPWSVYLNGKYQKWL